jgi:hypothetical protein
MQKDHVKKVIAIIISALLAILLIFVIIPPGTAVKISPGKPDDSLVTRGTNITFKNVNVTIRNTERIPINNLTFKVFNNVNHQIIGYVKFYVDGRKIEDYPPGRFKVKSLTPIDESWYKIGELKGTDEEKGKLYNFGYGSGYGSTLTDITLLYDIDYKTHITGTFYAKLFVNSTLHTFVSSQSSTFTVSVKIEGEYVESSDKILRLIKERYGIILAEPFYAIDSDNDGILDTFIDPNGVLVLIHIAVIEGNPVFLISIDDSEIPEFLWDPIGDTIMPVTFTIGKIVGTECDVCRKTYTETVEVQKSKWVYIQVKDQCPDCELTVKAGDRIIPSDRVWRENRKVHVLDDPSVEYKFIWKYTDTFILFHLYLEVAPSPVQEGENLFALIALINVGEPGTIKGTLTYNVYKGNNLVWSKSESVTVQGHKTFRKIIPTGGFDPGAYTLKIVFIYGEDKSASASAHFTVSAGPPIIDISLLIYILIIIGIVLLILFILYKTGFIYIEYK